MIDICKRLYDTFKRPVILRSRGRFTLYPSQASIKINDKVYGGCNRRSFFEWLGYKRDIDIEPNGVLAAEMGNWFHDGIEGLIRTRSFGAGITILSAEQSFYHKDLDISGRTDLLILDNYTDSIHGIEIKSVGEWSGKRALAQPKIEHTLQSVVYLYIHNESAKKNNMRPVESWIVLYVSRDENWDLKKNVHGSPLRQMWQYTITLKDGAVQIQDQAGSVTPYPDITVDKILERYKELKEKVDKGELPDRDYDAQYSEEYITALYKADQLEYKKDKTAVEKWLKKGAKEGELGIVMGDDGCKFCPYINQCYSPDPMSWPKEKLKLYDIDTLEEEEPKQLEMF
jgi:hypothetical protein